jgi:hypothetical protein
MANYRKSFNLRNGVQVDDDNFIVNANGLVGIGTSVPIEILDVRGNARIVGLLTASLLNSPNIQITGFGTFGTITDGTVKINAGVITGITTSGIVTYYGDGRGLINIPTSQWVDINPGLSATSIYAIGRVGIATTNPIQPYFLHIGGDPDSTVGLGTGGVGITSRGNMRASGIITAGAYFSGLLRGEINSTGISTFTILTVGSGGTTAATVITSGVITSTRFVGSFVGIASTALSLTGNPNIGVGTITAIEVNTGLSTVGIITVLSELDVGVGATAFTALSNGFIGIGTANPRAQLQIRRSTAPLFEIVSNTGVSTISVGQSVGVGKSTGVIRFGSSSRTLDILNNDTGNFNFYLHAGQSGINTGRFDWLYGQTNTQIMSLTYDGKLGIGITDPLRNLHIVGTSTITSDAYFGNDIYVKGSVNTTNIITPAINVNSVSSGQLTVSGFSTFSGNILANNVIVSSGSSIGIGTTVPIVSLDAREQLSLFGGIGVNTDVPFDNGVKINGGLFSSIIGIGTTATDAYLGVYGNVDIYPAPGAAAAGLNGNSVEAYFDKRTKVGIGTTAPRAIIDFADAGKDLNSGQGCLLLIPRVTSAQRLGLNTSSLNAGSMIYNTTTSKFQGWTGVAWTDFN